MNKITNLKGEILYTGVSKIERFNEKNNKPCYLCGNLLENISDVNIDHIIPAAKMKYYGMSLKYHEYNEIHVHYDCNSDKGCKLPTQEQLDRLKLYYTEHYNFYTQKIA